MSYRLSSRSTRCYSSFTVMESTRQDLKYLQLTCVLTLCILNAVNIDGKHNLRILAYVDQISTANFIGHMDRWSDTQMWSGSISGSRRPITRNDKSILLIPSSTAHPPSLSQPEPSTSSFLRPSPRYQQSFFSSLALISPKIMTGNSPHPQVTCQSWDSTLPWRLAETHNASAHKSRGWLTRRICQLSALERSPRQMELPLASSDRVRSLLKHASSSKARRRLV